MHFNLVLSRLMRALWAVALMAFSASAAPSTKKVFDVPAGNAEATLREFTKQAGVQFVFDSDKVVGVKTAGVRGEFEPRAALDKMLANTGLVAAQDKQSGALTIQRSTDPNGPRAAPTPAGDRPKNQKNPPPANRSPET
jgi:iron complex outermembrane receptor protein